MRLNGLRVVTYLYNLMKLAAKLKVLHVILLSVLLIQMLAHATQFHHEMMMGDLSVHGAHAQHHAHEKAPPMHSQASQCVFASSPMLLCVFPFVASGIVSLGHVILQTFQPLAFVFHVPLPPPK